MPKGIRVGSTAVTHVPMLLPFGGCIPAGTEGVVSRVWRPGLEQIGGACELAPNHVLVDFVVGGCTFSIPMHIANLGHLMEEPRSAVI